jgi:A/G-specific adenine glycosylase
VGLVRRPGSGIWAGLHCLPAFESRDALLAGLAPEARTGMIEHAPFLHVLTHRDLHIHVVTARVGAVCDWGEALDWHDAAELAAVGLPAPVRRFLSEQIGLAVSE